MPARDEFTPAVKDLLAKRVGVRCSNPNCRQITSGPSADCELSINIGVASHITAAASGGPRFHAALSSVERSSAENGIWLCQNCAKLVDSDPIRFDVDLIKNWKRLSEEATRLSIEAPRSDSQNYTSDIQLIAFYAQALDRPAFQDIFHQEGSTEAFDKALEDTITAMNTGCLRARDGAVLQTLKGKVYLQNADWRQKMDVIVDLLRSLRARYALAKRSDEMSISEKYNGEEKYCFYDPNVAEWMDRTRSEIMQIFSKIAQDAGLKAPTFPRPALRR